MQFDFNKFNNDLSDKVFALLFGENWSSLNEATFAGPLINAAEIINVLMLSFVVAFSVKQLVQGAVGTASEGRVAGDTNSFWWPFRAVTGIAACTPLPWAKGLSVVQVLLLSILGFANGVANTVYVGAIDHLAESNFSFITASAPESVQEDGKRIAETLFTAHLTQNYILNDLVQLKAQLEKEKGKSVEIPALNDFYSHGYTDGSGYNKAKEGFEIRFFAPAGMALLPSDLGSILIAGEKEDAMVQAKVRAVQEMSNYLNGVTQDVIFKKKPAKGFLERAVKHYSSAVQNVVENAAEHYPQLDVTKKSEDLKEKMKNLGWMSAGAFPLIMSSASSEMNDIIFQSVDVMQMDKNRVQNALRDIDYNTYENLLVYAEHTLRQEPDPTLKGFSIAQARQANSDGDAVLDKAWSKITHIISGGVGVQALVDGIKENNPLVTITSLGHTLIDTSGVLIGAGAAASGISGAARGVKNGFWGGVGSFFSGGATDAAAGGAASVGHYVSDLIKTAAKWLFFIGIVFAYVIPFLPTAYWFIAMIGFTLLAVEVLFAAPFWGAAHAWSTQSSGFAGEMGKQGYFQLLGIFFRPTLYVLGFIAIFLILRVSGFLLGSIFEAFYFSYVNSDTSAIFTHSGLITSLAMMLLLGMLYLFTTFYLCSEGYSKLPQRVMSWIGAQSPTMGTAEAAQTFRTMVLGGAVTVSGAHGGGGGGGKPKSAPQPPQKPSGDEGGDNDPGAVK